MAYRLVCPVFEAGPVAPATEVTGHGTEAGYTVGGASSHATRCQAMADLLGLGITVRAASRGPQTADDFVAAARSKFAEKSAPVMAAAAEPDGSWVIVDGKAYRKA